MDENGVKNTGKTQKAKNDWYPGMESPNPDGRPKGSTNKYTITKLIEAIEAEEAEAEKEGGVSIFRQFVRMGYVNPTVMIALMKKFVADKTQTEITTPEPIEIIVKHIDKKIEE